MIADTDAIAAVVGRCRATAAALSDTDAIIALYMPDGVFTSQNSLSNVGIGAVHASYAGMAEDISPNTRFTVAEVPAARP